MPLRTLLALVGRHASALLSAGILVGIAFPPLATLAKPLLVPTLLVPLALALVRLDWGAIGAWRRRPGAIGLVTCWMLFASPVLVWALASALVPLGFPVALMQALVIMAACSPIVASVAIAMMVGLDASLAVAVVLATTALVPFTLPPMVATLAGVTLDIDLPTFGLRLALLVGSAFLAAWLIRRLVPAHRLEANRDLLDALTVLNLVVFGIAIMDGVTALAIARPAYVATAVAAAYGFNLLLQYFGARLFAGLGARQAGSLALLSGNRNMGLVLVALQGKASFDVLVFFALAQIPMYTLPALLAGWYRRFQRPAGGGPPSQSR